VHILLKSLLKESPEEVIIGKYARETLNWYDNVAYAFITFPTFSLICRNSTHGNILRNVNSVIRDFGNTNNADELKKLINEFFDKVHLSCSDIDAFIKDYKTGVLGNIIKKHGENWFLFNMPELRGSPVSLHGRAWPEKKIISCWNNLDDIKKNWDAIKSMFSHNKSKIGELNDYTVDYLDRDSTFHKKNVLLDLIPAKDIKNSDGKKSTLTPEEIRDLQKKLHTLPPAEKKQAMIKLGMVNFDAERNDARMNFMRGAIAEGGILLKDLLKEYFVVSEQDEEYADLNSVKDINEKVVDSMVTSAQKKYDEWVVDTDGNDAEVGGGGICHLVADALINALSSNGIHNCQSVCATHEQHVYVICQFREGIYEIDIPYSIYETGGGFSWKKIPNVKFNRNSVVISRLDGDPKNISNYVESM
jgi:hypothetical protein